MLRDGSLALVLVLVLVVGCGGLSRRTIYGPGAVTYSTNFDRDETPLSENGAWHHVSNEWTSVNSADGNAFGTQPLGAARGPDGEFNDSYAYLSGFPADQMAEAVIHRGDVDASCTHEVELLLRWADSPDSARGYECNLAFDGSYAQIVRWDGALGNFVFLATGSVSEGIHDGDTFSVSAVGNHITLAVNGVERTSVDDSTFTSGNPGIGFWRGLGGCGSFGDFGFTSFSASSIDVP